MRSQSGAKSEKLSRRKVREIRTDLDQLDNLAYRIDLDLSALNVKRNYLDREIKQLDELRIQIHGMEAALSNALAAEG